MQDFIQQISGFIADHFSGLPDAVSGLSGAALPILFWLGRAAACVIAILIVVRCARSLFAKEEQELWGFVSLGSGVRYELNHWENTIGRAKSADVRLNFPSVSRSHAALCRDDSGHWRIYPINTKNGVLLNGKRTMDPADVQRGDVISVGGVELYFFPADEMQEAQLAQRRTRPGKTVSAGGTLWLLTLLQALLLIQFLPSMTEETFLPIVIAFGGLCGIMWGLYAVYRLWHRVAYEAETLAFFLTTLGLAVIAAYSPSALLKQLIAAALGIFLFIVLSLCLRSLPFAVKLRWPAAAAAAALLAFNVVFGQRIFGAKNWVSIGPISFQPSEFVKIAFVIAGAATLDRLFAKRNIIFTVLFSAYCVGCLALMSDFGTALIFFVAFLCIAFLRTGDLPSVIMVTAAAGFAGYLMLHFKPYIADRFAAWRHVWEFSQTTGYQQTRTMSAIASGGLFGAGPAEGWLKYVGAANTDLVFGVLAEEFGLILSLCAVASIIILALYTLRCADTARSSFYTIASCAVVAMFVCQVSLNVLGAVDILPLTGVTFPFVSMGGSSMTSCWGLLAFLKAADTRPNASFILRLPKKLRPIPEPTAPAPVEEDAEDTVPATHQQGFFADRPDIPVDDIFGKEDEAK